MHHHLPVCLLQVFVGQQHHLGLEVDGITYEVTLNMEAPTPQQQRSKPHGTSTTTTSHSLQPHKQAPLQPHQPQQQQQALPDGSTPSPLVEYDPQRFAARKVPLPEVTLAGPLELLLNAAHELSLFLPGSTDVGAVRRIVLAPGATVKVSVGKGAGCRDWVT
jgi:hypothetical protein